MRYFNKDRLDTLIKEAQVEADFYLSVMRKCKELGDSDELFRAALLWGDANYKLQGLMACLRRGEYI